MTIGLAIALIAVGGATFGGIVVSIVDGIKNPNYYEY